MAHLIRQGRIENANWPLLDEQALRNLAGTEATDAPISRDGAFVPLQVWRENRALCASLGIAIGIELREDDDLAAAASDLLQVGIASVRFPRFTNGRGYSMARLLRGRYGYDGELRAVGDVMRDQIFYLSRVGFDAFELRADQDPAEALQALRDFSEPYQASSDRPLPLFRRRAA